MFKKITLAAMVFAMSAVASADVILTTPEEIIVVAINDQEMRSGLFGGAKNNYRLEAGGHQIAVKYQQIFEENYISHDVVRSSVVTLNTPNLNDGETYQLVLVNAPKDHDAAKKFAQQPTIGLKNQKGEVIAQQTGANTARQPWLSSVLGKGTEIDARDSKKVVPVQQAIPTAIAPVEVAVPANAVAEVSVSTTKIKNPTTQTPITELTAKDKQLISLWQTATPQERQKFMAWLAEQASK